MNRFSKTHFSGRALQGWLVVGFALALFLVPSVGRSDCSLTTGLVPLPDLGTGTYKGFQGGLYPGGAHNRPAAHEAAGLAAASRIKPLNSSGIFDSAHGKIGFISIGLSNTTWEFAAGGENAFKPRVGADPSTNSALKLVDGAQVGKNAVSWTNPNNETWTVLAQRLVAADVRPAQVQVAWLKLALDRPQDSGAFPAHAQALQMALETIVRMLKTNYPNLQVIYLSSRTRAYTEDLFSLNPEPYAYESAFAVQWMIANQINGTGDLNFDASKGAVVAPYLCWGPYIWADGTNPRSDGFTWLCSDLDSDFTHPSSDGVGKVADQLLSFFETDPTTTSWFLKKETGAPSLIVAATPAEGPPGFAAQFNASAAEGVSYYWTFDDGTFSTEQNPSKIFFFEGTYNVHLTVTTATGDHVTTTVPITVSNPIPVPPPANGLLNVSARLQVGLGENVGISGFIVEGTGTKRLILRSIAPSLAQAGVVGTLRNPFLELHDSTGATIGSNDNWETTELGGVITENQRDEIQASGLAPIDPAESALIAELSPGAYTAVVHGAPNDTGIGLAEVYDLEQGTSSAVANLSTRGLVQTGANVMIGGFIVGGTNSSHVVVRAIGPSLLHAGVSGALLDPTLELRDGNGALVGFNENWADTQRDAIQATGLAPTDAREAAIEATLPPGAYTAKVAGSNDGVGVGLVEVYRIP